MGAAASLIALLTARKESFGAKLAFALLTLSALMGILTSIEVLIADDLVLEILAFPFLGAFRVHIDALSSFFLLAISIVGLATSLYSIGYVQHYSGHYSLAKMGSLLPIFFLSMCLVVAAGDVILFLVVWELMSLSSYLLVVYEHRDEGVRSSGWLYFVMTHLGTACIAACLLFISTSAGSTDFRSIALSSGEGISELARSLAFLLALVGFGTKAGVIPLHVWLPKAHPSAPSNVSALMSGVMVKVAIYMLIRTTFQFLGVAEGWWGLMLLLLGSVTAMLGVLYALAERDIKRSLAFSTVENVGIILIALGTSLVFFSHGQEKLAALALIACLLHVLFHSLFKSLLFLGAGAVVQATCTKDMERMGGLAKRMRYTSIFFLIGSLSISAIPPFNGFVSEWLIFQSLLRSYTVDDVTISLLMALALGMLAMTGALVGACFVRMYGSVFLARPRSSEAEKAHEVSVTMILGLALLAVLCTFTGVMSPQLIPLADTACQTVLDVSVASDLVKGLNFYVGGEMISQASPLILALLMGFMIPIIFLAVRYIGSTPLRTQADTWDCGTPLNARNEYTATGHSQPLRRVFNSILREKSEFSFESASSPYMRKRMAFHASIPDIFELKLYRPLAQIITGLAKRASVIQTGSIQRYLAYIFAVLILLLVSLR
ncbi:MAG: hydrogenase 4 subunit B [Methanomassiliicoccales archaeon]